MRGGAEPFEEFSGAGSLQGTEDNLVTGFGKYSGFLLGLNEVVIDQKANFNGEGGES